MVNLVLGGSKNKKTRLQLGISKQPKFLQKNMATRLREAEFLREKLCKGRTFFEGAHPGRSLTEKSEVIKRLPNPTSRSYIKNKATRPREAEFLREKLCKEQTFFEGAYPGGL